MKVKHPPSWKHVLLTLFFSFWISSCDGLSSHSTPSQEIPVPFTKERSPGDLVPSNTRHSPAQLSVVIDKLVNAFPELATVRTAIETAHQERKYCLDHWRELVALQPRGDEEAAKVIGILERLRIHDSLPVAGEDVNLCRQVMAKGDSYLAKAMQSARALAREDVLVQSDVYHLVNQRSGHQVTSILGTSQGPLAVNRLLQIATLLTRCHETAMALECLQLALGISGRLRTNAVVATLNYRSLCLWIEEITGSEGFPIEEVMRLENLMVKDTPLSRAVDALCEALHLRHEWQAAILAKLDEHVLREFEELAGVVTDSIQYFLHDAWSSRPICELARDVVAMKGSKVDNLPAKALANFIALWTQREMLREILYSRRIESSGQRVDTPAGEGAKTRVILARHSQGGACLSPHPDITAMAREVSDSLLLTELIVRKGRK